LAVTHWEDSGEKLLNAEHALRDLTEDSDGNGNEAGK
jgi:hypothetical protein